MRKQFLALAVSVSIPALLVAGDEPKPATAAPKSGQPTPLDHVKRIIIFVVNSMSAPSFDWNESENPPRTLTILKGALNRAFKHEFGSPPARYRREHRAAAD